MSYTHATCPSGDLRHVNEMYNKNSSLTDKPSITARLLHSLAASDVQRGNDTQSTIKLDAKPYTKQNEVKWRATSRHLE